MPGELDACDIDGDGGAVVAADVVSFIDSAPVVL